MFRFALAFFFVAQVALGAATPLRLITNSDTAWKVYHPNLLLDPEYKECRPFFKDLITAGGDVLFLPWPKDVDFAKSIKEAFPDEKAAFHKRFHRAAGLPEGDEPDIWTKDYLVFCEGAGACRLLSGTDLGYPPETKKPTDDMKEADKRAKYRAKITIDIGKKYEIPVARWPLRFEGGNLAATKKHVLMTKSNLDQGHIALKEKMTDADWDARDRKIQKQFEALVKKQTGQNVLWLEPLPEEGTGHLDMFLTVVGEKMLVGELPQKLIDDEKDEKKKKLLRWVAETLDHNAGILRKAGYEVTRVPMPAPYPSKYEYEEPGGKKVSKDMMAFPTYANSLQVLGSDGKRTVFLPDPETKNPELEAGWKKKIEAVFKKLGIPTKTIPRKCSAAIEKGFGSLSCVTGACPSPVKKKTEADETKNPAFDH